MLKNFKISKRGVELAVLFGMLCAVFCSFANFNASCEELRENVLRLHIIANSDSKADQELKLKIRDEILKTSNNLFETDTNLENAISTCQNSLDDFKKIAQRVAEENGFQYDINVKIGTAYFETREYESFTLPAGNYESLIIQIGEAKGKNWWCVIFPQVCIPAATEAHLSDSVGQRGTEIAQNPQKYVMKFKTVEIYENIKHYFEKK